MQTHPGHPAHGSPGHSAYGPPGHPAYGPAPPGIRLEGSSGRSHGLGRPS
ncbi:hypothetical protein [Intrasporangium mesophilum]